MSHSVPTASTAATYLVSEPRRLTLTCKTHLLIALESSKLEADRLLYRRLIARHIALLCISGWPSSDFGAETPMNLPAVCSYLCVVVY